LVWTSWFAFGSQLLTLFCGAGPGSLGLLNGESARRIIVNGGGEGVRDLPAMYPKRKISSSVNPRKILLASGQKTGDYCAHTCCEQRIGGFDGRTGTQYAETFE
jgi:hypothetical protein